MNRDFITKMDAVSIISLETRRSMRYAKLKLKAMADAGLIVMQKISYATAILITRADIDKVTAAIKAESEADKAGS